VTCSVARCRLLGGHSRASLNLVPMEPSGPGARSYGVSAEPGAGETAISAVKRPFFGQKTAPEKGDQDDENRVCRPRVSEEPSLMSIAGQSADARSKHSRRTSRSSVSHRDVLAACLGVLLPPARALAVLGAGACPSNWRLESGR
jgi:hypothetical protein